MSDLVKISDVAIKATKKELAILSVYKTNKVATVKEKDVKKVILASIGKAIFVSGQGKALKVGEIKLMATEFYDILITKYMRLSVDEIMPIFYSGALGEYGDVVGITLKTFSGWVKAYLETDRLEALKKEKQEVMQKPEPTEEEKKEIKLDFFKECLFSKLPDIKNNKWTIKNESFLFDSIRNLELIEFTPKYFSDIQERTKERLKKKYSSNGDSLHKQRENSKKLKTLMNDSLEPNDFKTECRVTAFQEWVVLQISKGVDIEKIITDKILNN